ncbi:hypothetical protein NQ176_g10005 [Zarea fungicola]|uniref:Uncharacterized protein n=1 Tax=Zarea fungicola TaxID=93591 RepID=A0ACC1MI97_9HYPO|nr:hypothetical protein NQ176_g10005 [Lecanicillium fungicola]
MVISSSTGTHRRTAADEVVDQQETRQNYLDGRYHDWPNEAGFVGLTEHRGPAKLHVNGTIPAYAAGALYRTGPGVGELETAERGTYYVSHWFDGFAHTHRFDIAASHTPGGETTVTYSSRRQGEKYIEQVKKRGWRAGITFAQRSDPCVALYAKAMARFDKSIDNNVVVLRNVPGLTETVTAASGHRSVSTDSLVVTTDATLFQILDKDTLEVVDTGSQERFHPDLKGPLSMSHAQLDDETGDMFNVNLTLGRSPTYRFFRVNAKSGTTDIIATVAGRGVSPAYIHSFFLTKSYVVLCIPSSHLAWAGAKIAWTGNLLEAMKPFDKSARCQWIVVDRRHGAGVVARDDGDGGRGATDSSEPRLCALRDNGTHVCGVLRRDLEPPGRRGQVLGTKGRGGGHGAALCTPALHHADHQAD